MKHTTVYTQLLNRGYTDAQIRAAADANRHTDTRTFTIAFADTEDGPIVGLAYGGDFRAEEEYGIGELYKVLGGEGAHIWRMKHWASGHIARFEDMPSLIISKHALRPTQVWGQDLVSLNGGITAARAANSQYRYNDTYDTHYTNSMQYAQGIEGGGRLTWATVEELREHAVKLGIPGPLPRKKADLVNHITASADHQASATKPDVWPGWFHYGDTLVLRADRGIVADILEILHTSAMADQLAFGGGKVAFGTSMAFYDARDVGPKLLKQRRIEQKAYDRAMKALEPVAAVLKAKGHGWYALGNPRTLDTGDGQLVTRYWLNGHGRGPGYNKQPYGWYTLEELAAERFVIDINERERERASR